MKTTKLEDVKIEDASYGLQSLMKRLAWLEKNGWSVVQTSENDIVGQGCGNYKDEGSVDVHIHLMKKNDPNKLYLFEDKTTMKVLT